MLMLTTESTDKHDKLKYTLMQILFKSMCHVFKSSQVTFIYIALLTLQIVIKQLHNIKIGNGVSIM